MVVVATQRVGRHWKTESPAETHLWCECRAVGSVSACQPLAFSTSEQAPQGHAPVGGRQGRRQVGGRTVVSVPVGRGGGGGGADPGERESLQRP